MGLIEKKQRIFWGSCLTALGVRVGAIVFCYALLLTSWSSLAATFSASLDRDTITLGETATLVLTCNGGQPASEPSFPTMPNLQIAYVGPSSQFSFINGQTTSSITYNFRVIPHQAGDYTIPAVTIDV